VSLADDRRREFWSRVDKTNDCWLWTGTSFGPGYGHFWFHSHRMTAHRAVWEIEIGPIPENMHVLHHCDNPSCVRPSHLFLGTHADNMKDAEQKGRLKGFGRGQSPFYGEANPNSKLTRVDAERIRERYAAGGIRQIDLAREYGVSDHTISGIVKREWHVA
jgi:hypothetical protein